MNLEYEKITNLKELLSNSAKKYENKTLYQLEDGEITYKEAKEKVDYLGTTLIQMGLKDKKIAIISENRYEWEITFFAIICGTGIVVPLDKLLTKTEITTILKRAEVEAIFCSKKYEDILIDIKKDLKSLKHIISFDGSNELSFNSLIEKGRELLEAGNSKFIDAQINNEDIGFIMFTSGTTEKSKAVMLSHKNVCSNSINVAQVFNIKSTDIALSVLPLNHVLEGFFCLLITIYKGATRVYCHDLKDIVDDINKYQISFMGAVPAIYEYVYKKIDEIDKENINMFMSGGAKLEAQLEQAFKEKGINLVQGYGITETAPVICMSNDKTHKIGSVGKVIPNTKVKLVNKDINGIGEIAVKGENVFLGYYQDKEKTQQVLKEGWFYTGDLASIDDEGYVFFQGRIKNMIVLPTGKKIFPEEIESIINKLDDVKESFVFEKRVAENKVIICAEIVCENINKKQEILEEISRLNNNMASYKNINSIYVTEEGILKTPTGKIKRKEEFEKVKLYIDKQSEILNENDQENDIESIKEILSKQLGTSINNIKEDINIADLGADSLDKVEIIFLIEKKFNIKIPKEKYIEMNTVKNIVRYLVDISDKHKIN